MAPFNLSEFLESCKVSFKNWMSSVNPKWTSQQIDPLPVKELKKQELHKKRHSQYSPKYLAKREQFMKRNKRRNMPP